MARVSAAASCPTLYISGGSSPSIQRVSGGSSPSIKRVSGGSSPSIQRVSGSSSPSTPRPLVPTLRAARCCHCPTSSGGRPTPGPPLPAPSSPPRKCSRTLLFLNYF